MQQKPERKKIDKHVVDKMKKNLKNPNGNKTKKYYFHWDMYDDIVGENLENVDRITIIPVRFDEDGAADYRRQWGFENNHPRGLVEGYTSLIIKLEAKQKDTDQAEPADPEYFHFCTICPPPDDCPEKEPYGDAE